MELILALLVAGPAGYLAPTRRLGLVIYLCLWALTFPIQTVVVFALDDSGNEPLYWDVNAVILAGGLTLNQLGWIVKLRRRERAAIGHIATREEMP
jgi:hypothetical protein